MDNNNDMACLPRSTCDLLHFKRGVILEFDVSFTSHFVVTLAFVGLVLTSQFVGILKMVKTLLKNMLPYRASNFFRFVGRRGDAVAWRAKG